MFGFLYAMGLWAQVASAVCIASVPSIPGVGTDQLCTYNKGCPKRAQCFSSSSPSPRLSSRPSKNFTNCTVTCANTNIQGSEYWRCVGDEVWEREQVTPVLGCVSPLPKPCPPFPPVTLGKCPSPAVLGYVVDRQLDKCNELKGCPPDSKRYAKGQLFQDIKVCQIRLKVCQKQANTSAPTPIAKRNSNTTTASTALINNNTNSSLLSLTNTSNASSSSIQRNSSTAAAQRNNSSIVRNNSSIVRNNSSIVRNASALSPPIAINNNSSNLTFAPTSNTSAIAALSVLGVPIPTPAPVVPPATKKAQDVVAQSLLGGSTSSIPLIQGPWGGAGVDVDVTMQALQKLNPTFNFTKTPEFDQYTPVVSDHFARLLYDQDNMLVRIVRS